MGSGNQASSGLPIEGELRYYIGGPPENEIAATNYLKEHFPLPTREEFENGSADKIRIIRGFSLETATETLVVDAYIDPNDDVDRKRSLKIAEDVAEVVRSADVPELNAVKDIKVSAVSVMRKAIPILLDL